MRPHTLHSWYCYFSDIRVSQAQPVSDQDSDVHAFIDGSCLSQSFPTCRVAAWGSRNGGVFLYCMGEVIDSGPLPGILQSAYSAEIYAAWRALCSMRLQSGRVFLWSDCAAVVSVLRKILRGDEPKQNGKHYDLWLNILQYVKDFRLGQVEISKVAAHGPLACAFSPLEECCFAHNSIDQWDRSVEVWKLFDAHVSSTMACQKLSRIVQQTMLAISKVVVRDDSGNEEEDRAELGVSPPVPEGAWTPAADLSIPVGATRWYGDEVVRQVLSWFWQAVFQSSAEVVWVSQYHLYIDFMLCGETGPTKLQGWRAGRHTPFLELLAIPFHTRARWFNKVLKECLRHLGHRNTYNFCRPKSIALFLHTGCLALPWSDERLRAVDQWILDLCPGGVRRRSRRVENFLCAARNVQFPTVRYGLVVPRSDPIKRGLSASDLWQRFR